MYCLHKCACPEAYMGMARNAFQCPVQVDSDGKTSEWEVERVFVLHYEFVSFVVIILIIIGTIITNTL